MNFTLNDFLFIAFGLGFIINYLLPSWQFQWKEAVVNLCITVTVWYVTQYLITQTPQTIWGQVLYVCGCIAFGFHPIAVYRAVTTAGLDKIKNLINKKGSE